MKDSLSSLLCPIGLGLLAFFIHAGTLAYATEPEQPLLTTITLEQPVYFLDENGDNIQVKQGAYDLEALSDGLLLHATNEQAPIAVQATIDTHAQEDLPEPLAASVPGLPGGEFADTHLLTLLLPGGTALEAKGTYSGIRSRAASPHEAITDPRQIYLDKPVHFQTPDGGNIVPPIGTYNVEPSEQGLQLVPMTGTPIIIETSQQPEAGEFEVPIALSLPGEAGEEADAHYVVLLQPDGTSHQSAGTYSGLHSRGLFKKFGKSVRKARKNVRTYTKHSRQTLKHAKQARKHNKRRSGKLNTSIKKMGKGLGKVGKSIGGVAKHTGKNVGRFAKRTALAAKKTAEATARLAAKGGKAIAIGACKAGLKTARIKANIQQKILGPVMREIGKAIKLKKVKAAMKRAVERVKRQQGATIQQAIATAEILANPKNMKSIKRLTSPNHICQNPGGTIKQTIRKMVEKPLRRALNTSLSANAKGIRSRGAVASATIGISGGGAKIGGGDIGLVHAFDFSGNKKINYLNLAGMLVTNIGGGGGIEIGIWPRKNPDQVGGWFIAAGTSFPIPHPKVWKYGDIAVDFYWAFPLHISKEFISFNRGLKVLDFSKWDWLMEGKEFWKDHFQGFTVRVGGGVGKSPVDISVQTGVGIRLTRRE